MRKIIVSLLLLVSSGVVHAEGKDQRSLFEIVQEHYGGRLKGEQGKQHFCTWDARTPLPSMGGAVYAIGSISMPEEVCQSLIRLLSIQMESLQSDNRDFNHERGIITYLVDTYANGKTTSETLSTCGTTPIRKPFEEFTPALRDQIKETIRTKGMDAGLKELNNFLNRNIQLECVFS